MRKMFIPRLSSALALTLVLAACGTDNHEQASKEPKPEPNTISLENKSVQKPLETQVKNGNLGGTYRNAGVDSPLVILVPGSGPTDKDGNGLGFKANSLKFLAEDLASQGISSLRVDKHGMFTSAGAGDPNSVTVDIYAQDYRSWASFALKNSGNDCVFLAGHSEGGLMVTAAALNQDNICGVITIASPGYRLSDVLRKQLKANPQNEVFLDDALAAITTLESGETVDTTGMHPALMGLFNPAVQPYLISVFQADPATMLAEVDVPKLVIQGSHDIQVGVEDAQRLSKTGQAELVILDGIGHVLKPAPKERNANVGTYNSPDTPIDPAVANAISGFINRN